MQTSRRWKCWKLVRCYGNRVCLLNMKQLLYLTTKKIHVGRRVSQWFATVIIHNQYLCGAEVVRWLGCRSKEAALFLIRKT